ncbi:MAG: hypothetical protein Sv326_0240 [Candidatus Fermentimicrarchaeum limneticum]|uniref:Uncharacterized protein n=1 Tax=Fermentimicrarchaeum limneticum TaxID=2795018 RepID=A0A7D6BGD1_FERL1|nr:MAG: hypothetical protein Sv326_0240 [Candidatus Fermentimicrarchaeum limneticum]
MINRQKTFMKISHLLLAILFFSSVYTAATATDVNLFVYDYLGENETFTKISFNLTDGEYYIVSINEEPSFIVRSALNGSVSMITDREGILDALTGYYATQGITYDNFKVNQTEVDELLSFIDSYNRTRGKEFECKTYIGIDRFECIDLETCWRACYTPICQQLKIGAGKPFLELLWAFSNSSSYIDSNLSAFNEKAASLSELNSTQQIDGLILLVDNMKDNSVMINNLDLFNPMALGFCKMVNYNLTYLTDAKIKLLTRMESILPLLNLEDETDSMHNRTTERLSLKTQLKIDRICNEHVSNNSKQALSIKARFLVLNTTKMKDKLNSLEEAGRIAGCSNMSEAQITEAEAHFLSLSQQVEEYGGKLEDVVLTKGEVGSVLAGMQGDVLLYFKAGELNSEFSEISKGIDSADLSDLSSLEARLIQLEKEAEDANNNKAAVFLTGFFTSPSVVILVVLLLLAFFLIRGKKKAIKKKS